MGSSTRQYAVPDSFWVGLADGPTALWASPGSDLGRRLADAEAVAFPEARRLFDSSPEYLMLGIAVEGHVVHAMRLSIPLLAPGVSMPFLLRDVAASGQGVDEADLDRYYRHRGIPLDRTLSVESNVGLAGREVIDLRSSDLAYLAVFHMLRSFDGLAVFCHLNHPALRSFERVGIPYEPIAEHPDLRTPAAEPGEFDDTYSPKCLTYESAGGVFHALESLIPGDLWCSPAPAWWPATDEPVVDLRDRAPDRAPDGA